MAQRLCGGLQCGSGFRLVVLQRHQHLLRRQHALHDQRAAQDVFGLGTHQHVVAGDEGLALGTVDHQRVGVTGLAGVELQMARKHRTTQTHHAGIAQEIADFTRRGGVPVEGLAFDGGVQSIGFDHHGR